MASIISYDVIERHAELKKALLDLGYNTTLFHPNKTPEEAANDVQSICDLLEIRLRRCIATDMLDWFIFPDDFTSR